MIVEKRLLHLKPEKFNGYAEWRSQDYYKAWTKKICNTFIGVYIKNCKQIIKKSKKIAQFIGVYIRNSKGLHKKLQTTPGSPDLETAHDYACKTQSPNIIQSFTFSQNSNFLRGACSKYTQITLLFQRVCYIVFEIFQKL